MKSRLSFSHYIISFCICLSAGFLVGAALASVQNDDAAAIFSADPNSISYLPAGRNGQRSILIATVDDLSYKKPKLLGLWLALYIPSQPRITLIPLFPAALEGGPSQDAVIANAFQLEKGGSLASDFVRELNNMDLYWHSSIILDEASILNLIQWSEKNSPSYISTHDLKEIAHLSLLWDDPGAGLQGQVQLFSELCRRLSRAPLEESHLELSRKWSSHWKSDFTLEQALEEWKLLRSPGNGLNCEFPTVSEIIASR